jgi:hypothetical protein
VVAGAVLASQGSLAVLTRNRRVVLRPAGDHPIGTRVEIGFGPDLPRDPNAFSWVATASAMAPYGKGYDGKSSPFWYDPVQFHELLLAHGRQPVRSLIAQLDGCTGARGRRDRRRRRIGPRELR